MDFDMIFDRLVGSEGGFSDDKNDPGNWTGGRVGAGLLKGTKFGIAANTYGDVDIKSLTLEGAKQLYRRDWWLKLGADDLEPALVYQIWDFAVNAGMSTAKRALQRAAGVADDGIIGPVTIKAIRDKGLTDITLLFLAERLEFYTGLSTWLTYGKGWTNRVAKNLRYAAEDN